MAGMKKPLVVFTRKLPDSVEARMQGLFDTRLAPNERPMLRTELAAAVRQADILVPTISDCINAALIAEAGPNLKLIANFGNGTDHIDVDTATRRGIMVTNTSNVLTEDTADDHCTYPCCQQTTGGEANILTPCAEGSGWSPN